MRGKLLRSHVWRRWRWGHLTLIGIGLELVGLMMMIVLVRGLLVSHVANRDAHWDVTFFVQVMMLSPLHINNIIL